MVGGYYKLTDMVQEIDYVAMSRLFDDRDYYEVDSRSVWLSSAVREGEILVRDLSNDKRVRARVDGDSTRAFFISDSDGAPDDMIRATVYGICDALFYGDWVSVGSVLRVSEDSLRPSVFERETTDVGIEGVPKVVVYSLLDIASEDNPLPTPTEILIPVLIVPDDFVRVFTYHYQKVHEDIQRRLEMIYRVPYVYQGEPVTVLPEPLKTVYSARMFKRLYARRRYFVDIPLRVAGVISEGERLFEEIMTDTVRLPLDKVTPYRDVPFIQTSPSVFTEEFFSRRRF